MLMSLIAFIRRAYLNLRTFRLGGVPFKRHHWQAPNHVIPPSVIDTIDCLQSHGHLAYIVGGGIRDLLAGHYPKDFDIATSARPKQIQALFGRRCHLIGRRFKICLLRLDDLTLEITTFRAGASARAADSQEAEEPSVPAKNRYGLFHQDVWGRDFTINALYYDPIADEIIDFVGGWEDMQHKRLRFIGDSEVRILEDPVRMLRAVRIATKLELKIATDICHQIQKHASRIVRISPDRMFSEVIKAFYNGAGHDAWPTLVDLGLIAHLFPGLQAQLKDSKDPVNDFIRQALHNADKRIQDKRKVSAAFLYAVLLWPELHHRMRQWRRYDNACQAAFDIASQEILERQNKIIRLPKRICEMITHIWQMQWQMQDKSPANIRQLGEELSLRAAYDFLMLRTSVNDRLWQLATFWTDTMPTLKSAREKKPNERRPSRRRRSAPKT